MQGYESRMKLVFGALVFAAAAFAADMKQIAAAAPAGPGFANVRERPYRAKGDGKTDDTAAFQRALDAVSAGGGGVVFVPTGAYMIAGHLRVPPGTALTGVGRAPRLYADKTPGSTLLAVEGAGNAEGTPFLTLAGPNATLEGITVLYPNQKIENPPVPYPWTIGGEGGDNLSIINVLLVNPYQAVDFAAKRTARHYIRGLYGQPLFRGIRVDNCYDIGRIKDVHFWPFWSLDKKIIDFTANNAIGFIFQRTDWEVVDDIFVWGYKVGVELSASKDGGMNGQMSNVNLDNVDIGIDASATQPYVVHVSNLNIANAGAGTQHIGILGRPGAAESELAVRGASFWGTLEQAVRWQNPGTLSIGDSRFVQSTFKQPTVEILAGKAILHDNSFTAWRKKTTTALAVGPDAAAVSFHHNLMNGNRLPDSSSPKIQIMDNLP